jgi:hypothetical protein
MLGTAFETDFEDLIESDNEFDTESLDENYDEATRTRFRPRPRPGLKVPPRGNPMFKVPPHGHATKAELEALGRQLNGRIQTSAAAIKTLDGRTHAAEREIGGMGAALKKEIALRKKETAELKKGLDESRQIAMILPLIGGGTDTFSKLLPVLLYSGAFGGSTGSSTDSSNSNMMMTMMMVVALQK